MINLHEFAPRYRRGWDESRNSNRDKDPWMMQLMARKGRGHVYVHGVWTLAAATTQILGRRIARKVPGAKILQNGDDGINVAFPPEQLDAVAKILRLRTRWKLTGERLEQNRERLRRLNVSKGHSETVETPQTRPEGPEGLITPASSPTRPEAR